MMPFLLRLLLLILGILASLPLLLLLCLLPTTPISFVGTLYLLSSILIATGMIVTMWRPHLAATLATLGVGLLLITLTARIVFPPSGAWMRLVTLPGPSAPRWWNRIFDEQDVVIFGARLGPSLHLVSATESDGLVPAFVKTYAEMRNVTPLSPFLMTYTNQEHPDAFDAVIAEPSTHAPPKRAIIFLHGFGGSFTLQCWLVAHAADRLGMLTICPSTGPSGDWWSPSGQAILQQTLSYLKQRGIQRVYLAGLSNGGIGASQLAYQFESHLAGLILISGADPSAEITGLPVLVIHGRDDERIPNSYVERYVAAAGASATDILRDGDHFLLLKQVDSLQTVIADWIAQQEAH